MRCWGRDERLFVAPGDALRQQATLPALFCASCCGLHLRYHPSCWLINLNRACTHALHHYRRNNTYMIVCLDQLTSALADLLRDKARVRPADAAAADGWLAGAVHPRRQEPAGARLGARGASLSFTDARLYVFSKFQTCVACALNSCCNAAFCDTGLCMQLWSCWQLSVIRHHDHWWQCRSSRKGPAPS